MVVLVLDQVHLALHGVQAPGAGQAVEVELRPLLVRVELTPHRDRLLALLAALRRRGLGGRQVHNLFRALGQGRRHVALDGVPRRLVVDDPPPALELPLGLLLLLLVHAGPRPLSEVPHQVRAVQALGVDLLPGQGLCAPLQLVGLVLVALDGGPARRLGFRRRRLRRRRFRRRRFRRLGVRDLRRRFRRANLVLLDALQGLLRLRGRHVLTLLPHLDGGRCVPHHAHGPLHALRQGLLRAGLRGGVLRGLAGAPALRPQRQAGHGGLDGVLPGERVVLHAAPGPHPVSPVLCGPAAPGGGAAPRRRPAARTPARPGPRPP